MLCSRCKQDKPDKAYPHNYGKRNGSTCLECRRKKYKTRTEVARSKVHKVTATGKKCIRCKEHPVKKGNYFYCESCFGWASRFPEEFQGW